MAAANLRLDCMKCLSHKYPPHEKNTKMTEVFYTVYLTSFESRSQKTLFPLPPLEGLSKHVG